MIIFFINAVNFCVEGLHKNGFEWPLPLCNHFCCTSLLGPVWHLLGFPPFYNKIEFVVPQTFREAGQIPKCCNVQGIVTAYYK